MAESVQTNPKTTVKPPFIQTSLTEVTDQLPIEPPCRIFFKNEYEQPSGSFKLRGIGNLVAKSVETAQKYHPNKFIQVFASSGGNAGLAAAYLAKFYNLPCIVCIPASTKPEIIDLLHELGAKTIMKGENILQADKHLKTLIAKCDLNKIYPIYCHPFDNPLIWQGHLTLVDEILQEQLSPQETAKLRGMVASIGGGGLFCGIMDGIKKNDQQNTDVLLVESKQAPTFTETIKAGEVIQLKSVKSLATSLACSHVTTKCLDYYNDQSSNKTFVESIDDLEAVKGSVHTYNHFNIAVEPACGAAMSVVFNQLKLLKHFNLSKDDIVVIVVCGGSCTNKAGIESFNKLLRLQVKL